LETVLTRWGAQRDRRDPARWRTERGPLSVTDAKFFNWRSNEGGGGAIDLVMHLGKMDPHAAILWLQLHLGGAPVAAPATSTSSRASSSHYGVQLPPRKLRLPPADPPKLERVRRYLTEQRHVAPSILELLIDAGKVYADQHANAVFLMVAGKPNRPIGAELRGTGTRLWHGLAPGTLKDDGYFWIGTDSSQQIILCESAIDAISCFQFHAMQLHTECICISTAGVRPDPPWLDPLIARCYHIHCGFDNDHPGQEARRRMIACHPSIHPLPPPAHDWNDALRPSR
jgi:hypothetical protein